MAAPPRTLILASASPRRRELLARVGIFADIVPADIDEAVRPGEAAIAYAARLADEKASVIRLRHPQSFVLAADTVVEVAGEILGKAEGEAEAKGMLEKLSGTTHRVSTAYSILGPDAERRRVVTTHVSLRALSAGEISDYVAAGEWRGKAGAYAIQGQAAAMVQSIQGSVTNVIGLPLAEVVEDLALLGAVKLSYRGGQAEP
jgi:septum formation protein